MRGQVRNTLSMTIVAIDPPFDSRDGVLFGLQMGREFVDPVPASKTTEFDSMIELRPGGSDVDFAGDHVHGRRGDRFLYLAWGVPDQPEPFVMFARAKIKLDSIPRALLDQCVDQGRGLIAEVQATNRRGEPASGTIRPPAIVWRMR